MLLELNCDSPYISQCMQLGVIKEPKNCPPQVVFLGKKRVSFDYDCTVVEYEIDTTRHEKSKLWYTSDELDYFRSRGRDDDSDDSSTGSGLISFNHMRRVVLNSKSYKTMDQGCDLLRDVSRQSSQRSREQARERAVKLSKSNSTWEKPQTDIMGLVGWNPRLADFYVETFMDMMESGWFCGGSTKEVE